MAAWSEVSTSPRRARSLPSVGLRKSPQTGVGPRKPYTRGRDFGALGAESFTEVPEEGWEKAFSRSVMWFPVPETGDSLLRSGMDLRTVMKLSGHSDSESVMRHLSPATD